MWSGGGRGRCAYFYYLTVFNSIQFGDVDVCGDGRRNPIETQEVKKRKKVSHTTIDSSCHCTSSGDRNANDHVIIESNKWNVQKTAKSTLLFTFIAYNLGFKKGSKRQGLADIISEQFVNHVSCGVWGFHHQQRETSGDDGRVHTATR